jgi:gluconolactonase
MSITHVNVCIEINFIKDYHMKRKIILSLTTLLLSVLNAFSQNITELEVGKPDAIVNLADASAIKLVNGQWKYSDAKVVEVDFKSPGADRKPTGPANKTNDIIPKAGATNFDDSQWESIDASTLDKRRGTGKVSFNWYRLTFIVPEKLGTIETAHNTIYFEIVVDDYAEVWLNGVLQKSFGQKGNSVISGYNSRNRIKLTGDAKPGDKYELAIFGINGPLSDIPENYIWIRSATLDFYKTAPTNISFFTFDNAIEKIDPELDNVIPPQTILEKVAGGFSFTEGPVWSPDGYLLFSDPNQNVIYRYTSNADVNVYRTKSGYTGIDAGEYHQPGSNGLAFDNEGRLTICEHGNHRISRIEKNGVVTILADNYQGKRLNSPNDLVYRSDGALYFTDPPYGLPKAFDDKRKELAFSGVYCYIHGELKLVTTDFKGPNGIAFSPDEKYLYVSNWDATDIHHTKIIKRYEVNADGTLKHGKEFYNMNSETSDLALDGIKVDSKGIVYASGPDAIYVISPASKLLGKIKTPEHTANMAWGDDGKSLYITASTGLYRIKLNSGGKLAAFNNSK